MKRVMPAHRRHDISDSNMEIKIIGTAFAWAEGCMGRRCERQPFVDQHCVLDHPHRCAVDGFTAGLRELEKRAAAA
jgi:hypothetical protein